MPTVVVTSRFLFGPGQAGARTAYASLETTPDESFDALGGMFAPRGELDEDAVPDHHHHRPHAHGARPLPEPDHHHHRPLARETDHARPHHHAPSMRGATPSQRHEVATPRSHAADTTPRHREREPFLTPHDYRLTDAPPDKTGHHHRPFDKAAEGKAAEGRDWAPHMDPRGFVPHQKVKDALVKRGFHPDDASAITGNLIYESGGNQYPGNPVILNPPTGGHSGDAAWGAAQWEGVRKRGLRSPSLDDQVDHIWDEMHGGEPGATKGYEAMHRAKTVAEKAAIVNRLYERPLRPRMSERDRVRLADEVYRGREEALGIEHASRKRLLGGVAGAASGKIQLSGAAAEHGADYSLGHMQPEFRARLGNLMAGAKAAGRPLSVFSGYRSQEHQNRLFAGSNRSGHMVARHSHHTAGTAADLRGDIAWAHAHAHEYGLHFPMTWENWHIEPEG